MNAQRSTLNAQLPTVNGERCLVRWLRAQAARCHLDADRIGVWGDSAGGHLAALLGMTGDVRELEGDRGSLEFSSRVQAACDWFGPAELATLLKRDPNLGGLVANLFGDRERWEP